VYDNIKWTVYRRWGQWTQLDAVFRRFITGYTECMPKVPKTNGKFDEPMIKQRAKGLQSYCDVLVMSRAAIFTIPQAASIFFRFISPTQYGDVKGSHFVMPFKVEIFT